jgi:hypothetical protein
MTRTAWVKKHTRGAYRPRTRIHAQPENTGGFVSGKDPQTGQGKDASPEPVPTPPRGKVRRSPKGRLRPDLSSRTHGGPCVSDDFQRFINRVNKMAKEAMSADPSTNSGEASQNRGMGMAEVLALAEEEFGVVVDECDNSAPKES